ncbi:MAG: DUF5714 domain-containing protein [Bacteroidetes bacterium]|nr:DUF5714 domain-containing protein [Bacteroidota bacterium]
METKTGCLICGEGLVYSSDDQTLECFYCKGTFQSNVTCINDHFVCDKCHSQSGIELIETYCLNSKSINPIEMATEIMHSEKIKMHGPEHHFLVPAVLISSYCNAVNDESKPLKLETARKRAEKILGGFCGTHGNCGAGVGTGIFISVITHSTPLAKEEWSLSNLMTGKSLISIASHGGPRCCKRDVYLSILESIQFLKEKFDVSLDSSEVKCQFTDNNKECLKTSCLFYLMS